MIDVIIAFRKDEMEKQEDNTNDSAVISSVFLQVPAFCGRRRSKSVNNIPAFGENAPARKYSYHTEKPDKLNVPSSRINAISLRPLSSSISNISSVPSVRALRSLFTHKLPANLKTHE